MKNEQSNKFPFSYENNWEMNNFMHIFCNLSSKGTDGKPASETRKQIIRAMQLMQTSYEMLVNAQKNFWPKKLVSIRLITPRSPYIAMILLFSTSKGDIKIIVPTKTTFMMPRRKEYRELERKYVRIHTTEQFNNAFLIQFLEGVMQSMEETIPEQPSRNTVGNEELAVA